MEAGKWAKGRLWGADRAPERGEAFEVVARLGEVTIEQITSSDLPDPAPYDQDHDEWVLLLEGGATVEVEGEEIALVPGQWLVLAAHTRHSVLRCDRGTVWLAVHAPSRPE